MEEKFKAGDVVILTSKQEPIMVVERVEKNYYHGIQVYCVWNDNGVRKIAIFKQDMLILHT